MSVAAIPISPELLHKRRRQRILRWAAAALLFLLLAAITVRFLLIRQMRLPRLVITQDGNVTAVAITPDGKTIFTGEDYTSGLRDLAARQTADVFVWNAATGQLIRRLPGFQWRSSGILVSPDGKSLIASGEAYQTAHALPPYQVVDWN